MNRYITGEIPIESGLIRNANTVGEYNSDELQTVKIEYADVLSEQILYNAKPSCKHKIQAQWSGIKCIVCNGWYCA